MPEIGPNGRWIVERNIPADPGGAMAIISSEAYRAPCASHNPGVPIYLKKELALLKRIPRNAQLFRFAQRVKGVFRSARISEVLTKEEAEGRDE
jgi:hypothetical protein